MLRLLGAGLSALLGVLGLLLVVSALSVVGFGERADTEPMTPDGRSQAIVLDQQLIPFSNTTAEVQVESDTPVFIGTANGVDAQSYLAGTAHEEVTGMNLPGTIEHRFVDGGEELSTAPDSRDWWITQDTGESPSVSLNLDQEPRVVVIAAEDGDLADARVSVSIDAPGVVPLALIGLALSIMAFALAVWLFLMWRADQPKVKVRKDAAVGAGEARAAERAGEKPAGASADRQNGADKAETGPEPAGASAGESDRTTTGEDR